MTLMHRFNKAADLLDQVMKVHPSTPARNLFCLELYRSGAVSGLLLKMSHHGLGVCVACQPTFVKPCLRC